MPSYGRFYVLGPPVEGASEVAGLVEYVMRQTTDMRAAAFSVHDVEGAVRYDSSWVPGGRRRELRHGLRGAVTGVVPNAATSPTDSAPPSSFTAASCLMQQAFHLLQLIHIFLDNENS